MKAIWRIPDSTLPVLNSLFHRKTPATHVEHENFDRTAPTRKQSQTIRLTTVSVPIFLLVRLHYRKWSTTHSDRCTQRVPKHVGAVPRLLIPSQEFQAMVGNQDRGLGLADTFVAGGKAPGIGLFS